jgi:hypothetical protein
VARRKHLQMEINPSQRRVAMTRVYLKMVCPGIDRSKRTKLVYSILALIDGEDRRLPQKKITDAQIVEMVWRHSQCVLNQTGKCPLLIFGKQLVEQINEYFAEEE